jgi:3-hydroxyisobutyrate dehydrogenase-like beta-hydroxyacid dehydrogenase
MWRALGGQVKVLPGPVGDAARVKLLRSVFMKGRDALIVETLLGARRYGIEAEVLDSIPQQSATEDFPAMVARVLRALDSHAPRRAQELNAVSALLREASVSPLMTDAAARRLEAYEGSIGT